MFVVFTAITEHLTPLQIRNHLEGHFNWRQKATRYRWAVPPSTSVRALDLINPLFIALVDIHRDWGGERDVEEGAP